jgi:Zn finger protein HypA/HybF involved in hydrogenase expression
MKRRRCAACDHRWRPRTHVTPCPKCKSADLFDFDSATDVAEWERAADEHAANKPSQREDYE